MATKKSVKKVVKTATKKMAPKATKSKVVKLNPMANKAKKTKVASKKPIAKSIGKITKPLTKSELFKTIADTVELNRNQVAAVFDTLSEIVAQHLKKDGPEKFVLPGMLKIVIKKVPAKPAREGINPFTKEPTTFKAKAASKKVKVIALRSLKNMC